MLISRIEQNMYEDWDVGESSGENPCSVGNLIVQYF